MNNKKSTKRALLSSVLSLLLCMVMLIGTTFAWFTDSVTSTGNIIKSGTLDVTMEWADGKTDPASAIWKDASEGAIFNYSLWEPGYTEVRHIKIANEGTLALKYQLNIIANGEVSKLADVIDVYYVDPAKQVDDRDDLDGVTKLGTLSNVLNNINTTASGNLLAGENHTVTLALKMQESAGNEYQGISIGSEFAVQVLATQLTSEIDNFDNQYDVEAEYMNKNANGEWEIDNIGHFVYFAQQVNGGNSYQGETVVLNNDIDLAGINWIPIGSWDTPFEGTFDGQKNTISNLKINAPAREEVGLFGCTMNATIKGINVKNVDILGYSQVATIVGCPYTECTISDCHVMGDVNIIAEYAYVGGIAGYGYLKVDNCSVIADGTGVITAKTRNAVGGITAWLLEDSSSVTNCQVKNLDLTGWANIGGVTGFVHRLGVIDNCSVENVNITKTRVDGHPSVGLAAGGWSYNASKAITITNNSFKNITLNGTAVAKDSANYLYGSEYDGESNSNFVIANNTEENIVNNVVCTDSVTKVANVTELQAALDNANKDIVISLTADINGNVTATQKDGIDVAIAGNGKNFNGMMTIFGNGRQSGNETLTISNINFVAANGASSCIVSPDRSVNNKFSYAHNVTIENCTFTDPDGAVNCAAIRHEDGGDKNWIVKDCTVDNTMHSLLQVNNVAGKLTIDSCIVKSKNGINLNSCTNVEIIDCKADVKGYAVRFGVSSGGNIDDAKKFLIKDSTLKSANDDGDAVIIFRADAVKAVLTLENTTLVGNPEISGATADTTINR